MENKVIESNNELFPPNEQGLFIVENHPIVVTLNQRERKNKLQRKYNQTQQRKIYMKNYAKRYKQTEKYKSYQKNYSKTPQSRKYRSLLQSIYRKTPKGKTYMNNYLKEYHKTPQRKLYMKTWMKSPIRKEWEKNYQKTEIFKNIQKRHIRKPEIKVIKKLRTSLYHNMKVYGNGKTLKSSKYGIDYQKIAQHLGSPPNDGRKYHIDHIKPCCSFNFLDPTQPKLAFAPENLRWLSAKENLKKIKEDKLLSIRKKM
jgi:hypothetical protein